MKARMSKAGSIKTLILISIIMLSGMALLASADQALTPNKFSGNVIFNGEDAPVGAVISASIGGELRGSKVVETAGEYVQLGVTGYASDEGAEITFTVDGVDARETAVWYTSEPPRTLDLTAGTGVGDGDDGDGNGDNDNGGSGSSGGISGSGTSGATPVDTTPKPGSIPDEEAMPTPSLTPAAASETPAATPKEPGAEPGKNKGLLPGFEAIFAIAGLLAVAYLIRRR